MTRIAFPFIGDTVGGSHRSAVLLMRELRRQNFDSVALLHKPGPLMEYLEASGVPYDYVGGGYLQSGEGGISALASLVRIVPRQAWLLHKGEYDLVHANDGRMITAWVPAARLAGIPSVAHRRTKWTPSRLADMALRSADKIVTISEYIRSGLPEKMRRSAVVIGNPIEAEACNLSSYRLVAEALAGGGGYLIAFVGTMQHQKRPFVFLEAAAHVLKLRPDARFLMIGRTTDMETALRDHAERLGLGGRFCFTGYRTDGPHLAAACNLLLAPAIDEGHGRVLVEAMMAGVPVIAADSGGHREIVKHGVTGILVPPDDSGALAEAALNVMADPVSTAVRVAAARAALSDSFSPLLHVQSVIEQYRKLGID